MKRLLTVLSVLALAHMLGLLGVVGWLAATERLNGARVEAIRTMLREPIPVELARLEEEQRASEQPTAPASDASQSPSPDPGPAAQPSAGSAEPMPSGALVGLQRDERQADEFRRQRLERETGDLTRAMMLERQRLDQERERLEQAKADFERTRAEIAALEGAEQFKAALSVLREVKPAEAKQMLQQVIEGAAGQPLESGSAPALSGLEQAVAYLDALGSMERGEIMSQFVKDSPELAAQLLERLRTFGMVAGASGEQGP